uniref:Reverse transcriptase domain-containing protein n=2 Tax=Vitis vinifera TaxID=29760 RepID=A5ALF1_VITVI|nr:hypothetical protein VITISV_015595 [Vitis vinifera]
MALGFGPSNFESSTQFVKAYDSTRREDLGIMTLELQIGTIVFSIVFQVLRIPTSFNPLLGRPWIHRAGAIPSSFHQKVKFIHEDKVITIQSSGDIPSSSEPVLEINHNYRYMAYLHKQRLRAQLLHIPFDHPLRLYTIAMTYYFVKASEMPLTLEVEYPEWLDNVVPVPKKDDKVRVYVDFKDLNKDKPKDDFPLPHIDMLRATTTLFHDMMHRDIEVYVDDMIVKSWDKADHLAALERFFKRIRQFRLRLNPKKCTFGVTFGKLLRYMVSEKDIEADPKNIRVILEISTPRIEKEIRGFLGRLQFINRFIARLINICEHIFQLLRKNHPIVWDDHC